MRKPRHERLAEAANGLLLPAVVTNATSTPPTVTIHGNSTAVNATMLTYLPLWNGANVWVTRAGSKIIIMGLRENANTSYHEDGLVSGAKLVSGFQLPACTTSETKGNLGTNFSSNGILTAPVGGIYSVGFSILTGAATVASTNRCLLSLSGSVNDGNEYVRQGTSGDVEYAELEVSITKYLAAGSNIYCYIFAGGDFVGVSIARGGWWATLLGRTD